MDTPNRSTLLYGLFAFLGVLAPWVWFTGMLCFALDRMVMYLAQGRKEEMRKLISQTVDARLNAIEKDNLELRILLNEYQKRNLN